MAGIIRYTRGMKSGKLVMFLIAVGLVIVGGIAVLMLARNPSAEEIMVVNKEDLSMEDEVDLQGEEYQMEDLNQELEQMENDFSELDQELQNID